MTIRNIFTQIPQSLPDELTEVLLTHDDLRIERIVSRGHTSPPGFWYEQEEHEWILLLSGAARLAYDSGDTVALKPGDHLLIPAHCRHRVEWTQPDQDTIWLAIFYHDKR